MAALTGMDVSTRRTMTARLTAEAVSCERAISAANARRWSSPTVHPQYPVIRTYTQGKDMHLFLAMKRMPNWIPIRAIAVHVGEDIVIRHRAVSRFLRVKGDGEIWR